MAQPVKFNPEEAALNASDMHDFVQAYNETHDDTIAHYQLLTNGNVILTISKRVIQEPKPDPRLVRRGDSIYRVDETGYQVRQGFASESDE